MEIDMRQKGKPNHGIYAMFAFRGVAILAGFLSWRLRWRSGLLWFGLATALVLGGCSAAAAYHFIAPAETPDGVLIHTPEELAAAPNVSIKTDDPIEIRRLFNLAGHIMIEPWQIPLKVLNETKNYCLNDWPKETGHRAGSPLGSVYRGGRNWTALCFTEAPYSAENAKKLCAVIDRPLLQNIPERRTVVCGAVGGTGV